MCSPSLFSKSIKTSHTNVLKDDPYVYVIHIQLPDHPLSWTQASIEEGQILLKSNTYTIGQERQVSIKTIRPATYIGIGIIDEIYHALYQTEIKESADRLENHQENPQTPYSHVFINTSLNSIQKRNLEKHLQIPVFDRMDLILDIFTKRSTTKIGKVQAQLAKHLYSKASLSRKWTHLERQRSGGKFLGGPGELQLELDRRLLSEKIASCQQKLQLYHKTKMAQQTGRKNTILVAFVGYTNVGKSSLFNRLTYAKAPVANQLFATLHPLIRKLNTTHNFLCIDTVGLINDLPSFIMAGFAETFNVLNMANIIIHVKDVSSPWRDRHDQTVDQVFQDLHIPSNIPVMTLWNKADLLTPQQVKYHQFKEHILCSTKSSEDMLFIIEKIKNTHIETQPYHFFIPYEQGKLLGSMIKLKGTIYPVNKKTGWDVCINLTHHEFYDTLKELKPFSY